jgi:superoxide reductase
MVSERLEVYRCNLCGNMVEVVKVGGGTLVCCGQEMERLIESSTDAAVEKHVPVVEQVDGGTKVTVGEVAHPMEEAHLIEWIELIVDGKSYTQFLAPGEAPEAFFPVVGDEMKAREYCNLHGLWRG